MRTLTQQVCRNEQLKVLVLSHVWENSFFAESLQEKIELIQTAMKWPISTGRSKKLLAEVKMFDCTCKESTLILTRLFGRSEIVGYGSNVFIDLAHLSRDNLIPSLCWGYWLCQRFQYSEMFYHDKQWLEDSLRCTQCVHTRKARVNFFQSVQLHSFLSRNLSLLRHIAKMSSGPSAMCGHSCWASCSVQKSQWTEVERERPQTCTDQRTDGRRRR